MKVVKKLIQGLFWILILALLIAPLGILYQISAREMKAYEPPIPPALKQTAYGELMQAHRWDVSDYLTVSGTWISEEEINQDLNCWNPWVIRWRVEPGAEIHAGQVLGSYLGKDVVAKHDGILLEINASSGENAYLRIRGLEATVLECRLDQNDMIKLIGAIDLRTQQGNAAEVTDTARVPDENDTYAVRLRIAGAEHVHGETEKNLILMTGQIYRDALVLDESCVYQKQPGADQPWYALQVQADGTLLGETEVTVGFRVGNLVCVSGVPEGAWFDSGYKAIVQSAYESGAFGHE